MSIITLQIGQCGNQLGDSFYDFLYREAQDSSEAHQAIVNETFFLPSNSRNQDDNKLRAKALLIDMEPKVVNKCLTQKRQGQNWEYSKEFSFYKQEGSGNNWAYGFNIHGNKCREQLHDRLQSILEQVDFCSGILCMQSLAGGTGSGIGSYMLELIGNEYPELQKINVCVVPHISGEVILQSYNCTLTISSLYENTDGIILIENDNVQEICNKLLNLKRPTLDEMNNVIAHQLNSIFFPVINNFSYNKISSEFQQNQQEEQKISSLQNQFNYFNDIQESLLYDPKFKLMTIKNVPQMPHQSKSFCNDSWSALEKRMNQILITKCTEAQINWSIKPGSINSQKMIGSLMIARGADSNKYDFLMHTNPELYYNQRTMTTLMRDVHNYNKNDRSISCLSNSQFCVEPLEIIIQRAHEMFRERAYIYQYEKFGLSSEDFLNSLGMCEQILYNYQNIGKNI